MGVINTIRDLLFPRRSPEQNADRPFGRYTDRSRQVMYSANDIAKGLNHDAIDAEHILLGMLALVDGLGCAALRFLSVDISRLGDTLYSRLTPGARPIYAGKLPTTPVSKGIIDHARIESIHFGDDYVGTEHLCVSLACADQTITSAVLREFGATPEELRAWVLLIQASALIADGSYESVHSKYEKAIALHPNHSSVNCDFAFFLSTCDDDRFRDAQRGLTLALCACEGTAFGRASCLDTLAAAYASAGQFEEAIRWEEKAIELAGDPHRASCTARLDSFRAGRPWREKSNVQSKRVS